MVDRYEQIYAGKYPPKDCTKQVDEVVSLMRARYLGKRRQPPVGV